MIFNRVDQNFMEKSKFRWHEIIYINDAWIYADNKTPVSDDKNRPCGKCGKSQTSEGHDGCLGTLPNVFNACCGHGSDNEAYVIFNEKTEFRGKDAIKYFKEAASDKKINN